MDDLILQTEKRIKQLGIKKGHVARKIGCSQMMFTHFLKGRRTLNDKVIIELKSYLDIE